MKAVVLGRLAALCAAAALLPACTSGPPSRPDDLCSIFQEKDRWYVAAHAVHDKYGVPIDVVMAIVAEDSDYSDGQLPMRWAWIIPYGRGGEAPGYARAGADLWEQYVSEEGSFFSARDNFGDALDFIGWYMTRTREVNGVAFMDAYNQYLNYIEGWEGYAGGAYKGKDWLLQAASRVQERAARYRSQLKQCTLY